VVTGTEARAGSRTDERSIRSRRIGWSLVAASAVAATGAALLSTAAITTDGPRGTGPCGSILAPLGAGVSCTEAAVGQRAAVFALVIAVACGLFLSGLSLLRKGRFTLATGFAIPFISSYAALLAYGFAYSRIVVPQRVDFVGYIDELYFLPQILTTWPLGWLGAGWAQGALDGDLEAEAVRMADGFLVGGILQLLLVACLAMLAVRGLRARNERKARTVDVLPPGRTD
jgi:hypothetical protein